MPTYAYPNSPFVLHAPFPPAGDQPAAIDALCAGIENGLMNQTLLGVTGSGKTFTMANIIAREGVPAIIFAPNKTLAAQTYSEMRDFFPENAVEYFGYFAIISRRPTFQHATSSLKKMPR